jgi:hypothetical protein
MTQPIEPINGTSIIDFSTVQNAQETAEQWVINYLAARVREKVGLAYACGWADGSEGMRLVHLATRLVVEDECRLSPMYREYIELKKLIG